jgi:hypothetical protein
LGQFDLRKGRNSNDWKRPTDGPQTGDQIRSLAEEDGKEPDRIEDQQEEEMKTTPESSDETSTPEDDEKP